MTYQRTRDELEQDLRDQVHLLRRSAEHFDGGDPLESLNMAVRLRVLLHDTGASTSLLQLLGLKDGLLMVDTAVPDPADNLATQPGLPMGQVTPGVGMTWVAPLGDLSPRRIKDPRPFADWWSQPVLRDNQPALFSRKDLVLAVAHKEGGAHVDSEMDEAAAQLNRSNTLGWVYFDEHGTQDPNSPVPASIRQITHEVLTTLERLRPGI